jgi:alpha-L-fucosidase
MSTKGREWFAEAKVGMFYHFGLYTLLGGNENGVRSTTSRAEYRTLMDKFTIKRFDADAWVDCAVSMGAQYIMPTSRHAEGFCLWDSALTRYKSTNAPCKRDIIDELAKACARKNVKFCVYFNFETWLNEGDDIWNGKGMSYPEYMEGQLTELLTHYGPIGIVWFDHGHKELTPERMVRIVDLIKRLQPDCLVNNRCNIDLALGKFDYISAERTLPPRHPENKNRVIECCDAMGVKSWGYHNEESFWSTSELAKRVSLCASRDYKYLLNVEPAPDGTIRPECRIRAKRLGAWTRKHRVALAAAPCDLTPIDPNLQHEPALGVSTLAGNTLYLHLHQWPVADEVLVKAVGVPVSAAVQGCRTRLDAGSGERGILVRGLPDVPPAGHAPWIVAIDCEAPPVALAAKPATRVLAPASGEAVFLSPLDAELGGPAAFGVVSPHINRFANGNISIGLLHRNGETLSWRVNSPEAREFEVYASFGTVKDQANGEFELSCGASVIRGGTWMTEHYSLPVSRRVGRLRLAEGQNSIVFRVTKANFSDVHGLCLVPA